MQTAEPRADEERRRFERHPIELAGQIERPNAAPESCLVCDYCDGGLLLKLAHTATEARTPRIGQRVRVRIELRSPSSIRPATLLVRVAWTRDDYLGVAFAKTSPALIAALRTHDQLAKGGQCTRSERPRGGTERALTGAREMARKALAGVVPELLARTTADLLSRAAAAPSHNAHQELLDDLGLLEGLLHSHSNPASAFEQALIERPDGPAREGSHGELRLVDPDEFECWLEASRVATLLEQRFSLELSRIGARLAALHGGTGRAGVPFEPQAFTVALRAVATQLGLGAIARRALFDRAAELLGDQLPELYRDLDQRLDDLEVPRAPPGCDQRDMGGQCRQPAGADSSRTGTSQSESTAPIAARSREAMVAPPPGAQAGCPGIHEAQLAVLAPVDPAALEERLTREASQREDLARELVGFVGTAVGTAEARPDWLTWIEASLVREASASQALFQRADHPLLRIVDKLGHLELFCGSTDTGGRPDPLRRRVAELLAPVRQRQPEPKALETVARSLAALADEASHRYQRRVERIVEASQARDRTRRARIAVAEELNRRYAGAQVPELILELLDSGWRAMMERSWLSPAGPSGRGETLLALLDALIGALGGRAHEPARAQLEPAVLCASIIAELSDAALDPFRRAAIASQLRRQLDGPNAPAGRLVTMPRLEVDQDGPQPGPPPSGVPAETWAWSVERCASLRIGDRLRLLDQPAGRQDLRIAWAHDDGKRFTLVDHQGLTSREVGLRELALGLHRQRIELQAVDGRPVSDQAIDRLLDGMQAGLARRAGAASATGLVDRRQFHRELDAAIPGPGRATRSGTLLLLDIDHFRLVNDVHGYDTGDRLLQALGSQLTRTAGAAALGHLGADRFAVLLTDVDHDEGTRSAERLCAAVRRLAFDWPGQAIALSASIGIVHLDASGLGAGGILQAAERALRAAKSAGGDQVYVYCGDDPVIARQQASAQWIVEVDSALERGELNLRCQPIVPVFPDPALAPHYEVLLGVRSASQAALPILDFIEAAERYHRMRAVDRWVTRTVIDWMAAHRQQMPALHGFAVNLSGQTAGDAAFVEFARDLIGRKAIDPSWLSFEVTETAAISDLAASSGIIRDLKALGCRVALDDFGSGQASYSYLRALPIDWLKIDGVFVRKIAADKNDYAVVKSINEIAHLLGKRTIAEYVIDAEVLRLVREIGVDYAQGFGISPPRPMDELLRQPI